MDALARIPIAALFFGAPVLALAAIILHTLVTRTSSPSPTLLRLNNIVKSSLLVLIFSPFVVLFIGLPIAGGVFLVTIGASAFLVLAAVLVLRYQETRYENRKADLVSVGIVNWSRRPIPSGIRPDQIGWVVLGLGVALLVLAVGVWVLANLPPD